MKLSLGILLSLIAVIHGYDFAEYSLYNPSLMFTRANEYQTKVTELQEDIVDTITGLRSSLSAILKRTSNNTLSQVQDNIMTVFYMDAEVRDLIFVKHNESTNCILNLRIQLNMKTEFSGFQASNCLVRYDRNVNALIGSAFETLSYYEQLIVLIQMIVVDAFNGKNIWTNPEGIETTFIGDYNQKKEEWDVTKAEISSFLATLESDIGAYNTVLGSCFTTIQQGLVPDYAAIVRDVAVCTEFDN